MFIIIASDTCSINKRHPVYQLDTCIGLRESGVFHHENRIIPISSLNFVLYCCECTIIFCQFSSWLIIFSPNVLLCSEKQTFLISIKEMFKRIIKHNYKKYFVVLKRRNVLHKTEENNVILCLYIWHKNINTITFNHHINIPNDKT